MIGETELKVYFLSSMNNIPSFLIWVLVTVFGIGCAFLILRHGWSKGLRTSAILLLAEWTFLILCTAVLFRAAEPVRQCHLIPFWSYTHYPENSYLIEAAAINALNVIMFIPIGLLSGLGFREMTWKKVLLTGLAFSLLIELLQFILKRGLCETDDLIHNILGCMVGFAAFRLSSRLITNV